MRSGFAFGTTPNRTRLAPRQRADLVAQQPRDVARVAVEVKLRRRLADVAVAVLLQPDDELETLKKKRLFTLDEIAALIAHEEAA